MWTLPEPIQSPPYTGVFEAHVTVASAAGLQAACAAHGVKAVLIELPRGAARSQPMTASYHRGTLQQVFRQVAALSAALESAGLPVVRVKLEALARNQGVPRTDAEAAALPAENYFEYHGKLVLPSEADWEEVRAVGAAHGAHLSRNARKQRPDGRVERFVTVRYYQVGRPAAEERFAALSAALADHGLRLHQCQREYTVYDSNWALDQGWME